MQHLHNCLAADMSPHHSVAIQARVRFLAYHRIKPHVPPLVRAPVNSFEFHRCRRTPQVEYLTLSLGRLPYICLLYTSDAADDLLCVDLGGRRIIKKKNTKAMGVQ